MNIKILGQAPVVVVQAEMARRWSRGRMMKYCRTARAKAQFGSYKLCMYRS